MARFPFLTYNVALSLGLPLLLPYYGARAVRHGKYLPGLKERLGYVPESGGEACPTIWLHAVSVGEVLAARPLALALRERFPDHRLLISTTTETGQQRAREQLPWLDGHFYFPLDMPGAVRRAMERVRPTAVVVLETEIWPNFLRACARRNIPVVMVNGRISDRSFRRYQLAGKAMGALLSHFTKLLMQSEADAERIRALGAPDDRVRMVGNLKYEPPDAAELERQDRVAAGLDAQFALGTGSPVVVAGSTVEGEEELVAAAFARLRTTPGLEQVRLVLAPRHPERFSAAADRLRAMGFEAARRSGGTPARTASVVLLDTVGELAAAYRFADVVFVGGSLVPRGGHNILEPAAAERAVVTGPYTENFRDILTTFRRSNAVWQLSATSPDGLVDELATVWAQLLTDATHRRALGRRARAVFAAHSGAATRTVEEIAALISGRSGTAPE